MADEIKKADYRPRNIISTDRSQKAKAKAIEKFKEWLESCVPVAPKKADPDKGLKVQKEAGRHDEAVQKEGNRSVEARQKEQNRHFEAQTKEVNRSGQAHHKEINMGPRTQNEYELRKMELENERLRNQQQYKLDSMRIANEKPVEESKVIPKAPDKEPKTLIDKIKLRITRTASRIRNGQKM